MKRQHPDNPDLFWCPKCKEYKEREKFYETKRGLSSSCIGCLKGRNRRNPNTKRVSCRKSESGLYWCPSCKEYKHKNAFGLDKSSKYLIQDLCRICMPGKSAKRYLDPATREKELKRAKNYSQKLSDGYISTQLKRRGKHITPETIELKRQHIIMIRTLKQFKEWRKEYESNNADVQREQRENEEADGRQGHTQP